jgi:hydrogenase/urease accessory protein HupE
MSNRRFILSVIALFILGTLPFLIVQPSATASAGLSLGFSAPLEHSAVLIMLLIGGGLCALLSRDGLILMPAAFTLMTMLGGMLMLDIAQYPSLRYFVLGTILCMGLMIGISREKLTVLMLLVLASLGFHLGSFYMSAIPPIAAPIYYLLGVLLSLGLGLAISIAFGVTLIGDHESAWEKLKESPRFSFIRGIFL